MDTHKRFCGMLLVFLITVVFLSNAWAAGGLSVTVHDEKSGESLTAARITVFHSVNAEIVADTISKGGVVLIEELAAGQYKVRAFQDGYDPQHYHYTAFYDTKSVDTFELGTPVTVTDGTVSNVDFGVYKKYLDPAPIVEEYGLFTITVIDSQTGLGIPGIVAQLRKADNALPVPWEKETYITNKYGFCTKEFYELPFQYKIRLFDPTGFYLPEYVPTDEDVFSLGQVYDSNSVVDLSVSLDSSKPKDQIAAIQEEVSLLPLPAEVIGRLNDMLDRSLGVLLDENPNNDSSACGALKGFVGQLNGLTQNGAVTADDANALKTMVGVVRSNLACK